MSRLFDIAGPALPAALGGWRLLFHDHYGAWRRRQHERDLGGAFPTLLGIACLVPAIAGGGRP